jgi:RNA polymerase sigma-70 factor (ECF subfamily)
MDGHTRAMGAAARLERLDVEETSGAEIRPLRLEDIYEEHFDFVWRSARRMGVREAAVDDVVQEVFLVAHRRLADFEGRSSIKTWLFAILLRVVSDYRRTLRRKGGLAPLPDDEVMHDERACPIGQAEQREAVRLLHRLLDSLDDEKRAVFVLAELEQTTAPEMSEALGVNLNTVYSRLRAARRDFEKALERHRARETRP